MARADAGEMNVTTDHEVVRDWAETHGVEPGLDTETGNPRMYVPGEGDGSVEEATWDEFFTQFEQRQLAFYYDDAAVEGAETPVYDVIDRNEAAQRATMDTEAVESALMEGDTLTTTIRETRVVETEIVESDTIESTVVDSEVVENNVLADEIVSRELHKCELIDEDTIETELDETRRVTREIIENNAVESTIVGTEVVSAETATNDTAEGETVDTSVEGENTDRYADERRNLTDRVERELLESGIVDRDIVERSTITSDVVDDETVLSEVRERTVIEEEIEETKRLTAEVVGSETIASETVSSQVTESEIVDTDGEAVGAAEAAVRDADDESETETVTGTDEMGVEEIHENAFGYDHWNTEDEYIVFRNSGAEMLDLSDWTIENEDGHTYQFPDGFTLEPDETVKLHTGEGEDTDTDLYWDSDRAIWKNDGDTITVRDESNTVVLEKLYS